MNFENHSHCTRSQHNFVLFIRFSVLYINTLAATLSRSITSKYTTIINNLNLYGQSTAQYVCVGIYVVLVRLAAAVEHIRNRSNGTKMNNFRFIIVLLYTHIANESLSPSLAQCSPCEFSRRMKTEFAQHNSALFIAGSLTHSCARCHQTFERCASVCTRIANWSKYVVTHACGNFSGLLASSKTVVFGCAHVFEWNHAVWMVLRVAELQNDSVSLWNWAAWKTFCEGEFLMRQRFSVTELRESHRESGRESARDEYCGNLYDSHSALKSTHTGWERPMSGGRKREHHICIVSFRSLNALYRNGNFVAMLRRQQPNG